MCASAQIGTRRRVSLGWPVQERSAVAAAPVEWRLLPVKALEEHAMRLYKAQLGLVVAGAGLLMYCVGLKPKLEPGSDIALGSSASDGDLADAEQVAATETSAIPSQGLPGLPGGMRASLGYAASGYVVSGYAAFTGEEAAIASNPVLGIIAAGQAVPGSVADTLTAPNDDPSRDPMPNSLPAGVQGQALAPLLAALTHIDGDPEATLPGVRVPGFDPAFSRPAPTTTQPDALDTVPGGLVDTSPLPAAPAALDVTDLPMPRGSNTLKALSARPSPPALATVSPLSEPDAGTAAPGAAPGSRLAPASHADGHAVSLALPAFQSNQLPGGRGAAVLDGVDPGRAGLPTVVDRFVAAGQEHDIQDSGLGLGSGALPDIGNDPVALLFSSPDRAADITAGAGPTPVAGTVDHYIDPAGAGEAATATGPTALAAAGVPEPSTLALIGLALLGLAHKRSAR